MSMLEPYQEWTRGVTGRPVTNPMIEYPKGHSNTIHT